MQKYEVKQLYLGRYDDLDPDESTAIRSDDDNERSTVTGWYAGKVFDTSNAKMLDITQNDVVTDPIAPAPRLEENDYAAYNPAADNPYISRLLGGDTYTYTVPGDTAPITVEIDSVFTWKVTIDWIGKAPTQETMPFIQLTNGDIFTHAYSFDGSYDFTAITLDSYDRSNIFGSGPNWTIKSKFSTCFDAGTMIRTVDGACAIRDSSVGQKVLTLDDGFQPVRWIGSRKCDAIDLQLRPNLRPIRIRAGALEAGCPCQDLVVSPQHRVLVRGALAQRMFNAEVLIAAKHLLELPGIDVAEDLTEVEYYHILFDRHQVIWSNGAATESLYAGKMALQAIAPEQLAEIFTIFPELNNLHDLPVESSPEDKNRLSPARYLVNGRKGRRYAQRRRQLDDKCNGIEP